MTAGCVCPSIPPLGDTEREWLPEMDNQEADPGPVSVPMALVPQTPNLYPATWSLYLQGTAQGPLRVSDPR